MFKRAKIIYLFFKNLSRYTGVMFNSKISGCSYGSTHENVMITLKHDYYLKYGEKFDRDKK